LRAVIAAQAVIGGDLVGAQHISHGEMILEMRITKLALQPAEVSDDTMQSRIIDATADESLVEIRFFRQHLIAERHSRLLHLLEERLRAAALVLREIESAREIEYVVRSRIAVELAASAMPIPRPARRSSICCCDSALRPRLCIPA
jgi:hypothetical protein